MDDLRTLERFLLSNHAHSAEWTAYTNLSAALASLEAASTPQAEAWLAALPELLEMEGKATPGEWVWKDFESSPSVGPGDPAIAIIATEASGLAVAWILVPRSVAADETNATLVCHLRNALHAAKIAGGGE